MRRKASRRGIALVFALFTTAVLLTLSVGFIAMAISQGRTSRSATYSQAALQAANYGMEFALNFMGDGSNWGISRQDASGFIVSFNLADTEGKAFHGTEVHVANDPDHPGFKLITFPRGNLAIDGEIGAQIWVRVREILMGNQPTHYQVVAQAEVFDRQSGVTLAQRVVEARVREQTAADFLHFIQNARLWDAPGNDPARVDGDGKATMDLVGIPGGYKEAGSSRIDGVDRELANGTLDPTDPRHRVLSDTSGHFRFYSTREVEFSQETTINKEGNLFAPGADPNENPFVGGLTAGQQSLGIPDKEAYVSKDKNSNGAIDSSERGYAARLAADTAGGEYVSGYVEVGGSNTQVGDGSFYADVERDPTGRDARPGISYVEVILDGEKVTVQKRTRYSNKVQVIHQDVHYSKFKNGLIYAEGGNVKVYSKTDGQGKPVPWSGRLTIVSNEDASRNPTGTSGGNPRYSATSIYHQAARDRYEEHPHLKPPYTAKELGLPGDGLYWPPPAENVEREGNTVIASDIEYAESGSEANTLGLISKNFVLLNDEQAERKYADHAQSKMRLSVDAVLMSLDHSVQFDWDNVGNNPWHRLLRDPLPGGAQKEFRFSGSIIGSFMDVQGDLGGHGYALQDFSHDQNLRYSLPPNFPRWDKRNLPDGVTLSWVVMQYVDRGALSTEGLSQN